MCIKLKQQQNTMLHPAQSPAQYKIRAIHQVPSQQNGYVAVFTAYINNKYKQMWCNVSPSDPAKLEMGYVDSEPTYMGGEVLCTHHVFVPLEYNKLNYSQLCEIIQHNAQEWAETDFDTSGVYAPNFNATPKKRTRATRLKIASILCRRAIANIYKLEAIIKSRTSEISERLDAKYPNRCKC